jgi:hypothetical protein
MPSTAAVYTNKLHGAGSITIKLITAGHTMGYNHPFTLNLFQEGSTIPVAGFPITQETVTDRYYFDYTLTTPSVSGQLLK